MIELAFEQLKIVYNLLQLCWDAWFFSGILPFSLRTAKQQWWKDGQRRRLCICYVSVNDAQCIVQILEMLLR